MLWHIVMMSLLFLSVVSMTMAGFSNEWRDVCMALYLVMELGVSLIMGWVMTKVNQKDKDLVIE